MKISHGSVGYKVSLLIITGVVGILVVGQVRAIADEYPKKNKDEAIKLSYEVIDLSRSNDELRDELYRLKIKDNKLSFEQQDKTKARQNAQERLLEYKKNTGVDQVAGPGVEVVVKGGLLTEEMVDLINGIRNIKPTAIGINGRRVIYKSYVIVDQDQLEFDNKKYSFPVTIQVIGNVEDIKKSLERSGGLLDILKKNSFGKADFSLATKDSIILPPTDQKIQFRYAKTIN
ncbi:MAG: DUF881 domain-containing protein [Patescibacteria group bacterium]